MTRYIDTRTGATWRREDTAMAPDPAPGAMPALTMTDAMTCDRFHAGHCAVTFGATGRARPDVQSETWRRNGRTRTWKRDPGRAEVPVKFGLYGYGVISADMFGRVHRADACPADAAASAWWAMHPDGRCTHPAGHRPDGIGGILDGAR